MSTFLITNEEESNVILALEDSVSPILLDVFPQAPTFIQSGAVVDTSAVILSITTNTTVSGGRLIGIDNGGGIILIDSSLSSTATLAVGITKAAALLGSVVEYVTSGLVSDSAWSWTLGTPIYAGSNGGLTQTAPSSGFILEVGKPVNPTQILVDFKAPLILI